MSIEKVDNLKKILTKSQLEKLLPVFQSEVWLVCGICGKVFYKATAIEFMQTFNPDCPSDEYLEAVKHWVVTDHIIFGKKHGVVSPISHVWVSSGLSKQNFLVAIQKLKEKSGC